MPLRKPRGNGEAKRRGSRQVEGETISGEAPAAAAMRLRIAARRRCSLLLVAFAIVWTMRVQHRDRLYRPRAGAARRAGELRGQEDRLRHPDFRESGDRRSAPPRSRRAPGRGADPARLHRPARRPDHRARRPHARPDRGRQAPPRPGRPAAAAALGPSPSACPTSGRRRRCRHRSDDAGGRGRAGAGRARQPLRRLPRRHRHASRASSGSATARSTGPVARLTSGSPTQRPGCSGPAALRASPAATASPPSGRCSRSARSLRPASTAGAAPRRCASRGLRRARNRLAGVAGPAVGFDGDADETRGTRRSRPPPRPQRGRPRGARPRFAGRYAVSPRRGDLALQGALAGAARDRGRRALWRSSWPHCAATRGTPVGPDRRGAGRRAAARRARRRARRAPSFASPARRARRAAARPARLDSRSGARLDALRRRRG